MAEEFKIELAKIEDMKNVFDLSNDELVRQNSFNQEKINWDNHQAWFQNKINDENCIFYSVKSFENDFVGYVRLDNENDEWILTIHLNQNYRGKGLGAKILNKVIEINKTKKIIAFVKEKNLSSYHSFIKVGFKLRKLINKNSEKTYELEN